MVLSQACTENPRSRFGPHSRWKDPRLGKRYWTLTKLDDVSYANRQPNIFSFSPNITIDDQTSEIAEYFGSMMVLDDPSTSAVAVDC